MLQKRFEHCAVALRDNIYVIGGRNWRGLLNTAEIFDTKTEQFTSIQSMQVPRYRFGAAIIDHKLYCFSGDNRSTVEFVDLYTKEWETKEDIPHFKNVTAVALYDD